jgi:hypothetical protein
MRAKCKHVSVLDFSQGLGHQERLSLDDSGSLTCESAGNDHWPASAGTAFEHEHMGVAAKE